MGKETESKEVTELKPKTEKISIIPSAEDQAKFRELILHSERISAQMELLGEQILRKAKCCGPNDALSVDPQNWKFECVQRPSK